MLNLFAPEQIKARRKIILCLGLFVFILGLTSLLVWNWGLNTLKEILPVSTLMTPSGALGMVLCGVALSLLSRERIEGGIQGIIILMGILLILLGSLVLFEDLFGLSVGFDQWLIHDPANITGFTKLVHMSPFTAYGFLLIGLALMVECIHIRLRLPIQFALAMVVAIIGVFALFGRVTDALLEFYFWDYAGMSLPTSSSFVLIGFALLLHIRNQREFRWIFDKLTLLGFGLGILLLLILSAGFNNAINQIEQNDKQIIKAGGVLKELGELLSSLLFFDKNQFKYVLSGDETLLNIDKPNTLNIQHNIQDLRELASNDAPFQGKLDHIESLIAERIQQANEIIKVRKLQDFAAAQKMSVASADLSDKIERFIIQVQTEAYGLLNEYRKAGESDTVRIFLFLPILLLVGITILFIGLLFFNQGIIEQKQLADQLRQSQKMEAIGQLTGGVAHDFNNLLGIILGNLDLLSHLVEGNERAIKKVKTAENAALRGADLTKRLLLFSRHQQLKATSISINQSIQNLIEMITRSLGPNIKIETELDNTIPPVLADVSGFESALVNLSINARDAMPKGGTLTISSKLYNLEESYPAVQMKELKPGKYACVAVSDTGTGMSKETLQRAFEPFFTTKPRGKGTGLGLAMVYGFAKQSGGYARIYSELNHGTSISLYLPLAEEKRDLPSAETAMKQPEIKKIEGTVLVVDDEPDLLDIEIAYLEALGLRVLKASDPAIAITIAEREPNIDLLVTDIIMPGMNGVELAQKVHQLRPNIKVVYLSGFSEKTLTEKSGMRIDGPLLHKPFQRQEFLLTISNVMDKSQKMETDKDGK